MTLMSFLGLFIVSGLSTLVGSLPVLFHHYMKEGHRCFWESFGGGVMISASVFSLFLPAWRLSHSFEPILKGMGIGLLFIFISARIVRRLTQNLARQRAYLFVFVMGLHNIPEGLSVGFDVAALGWEEALPLSVAIFIQNLPEGFVTSLSFLLAGFTIPTALLANAATALIETVSSVAGFAFVRASHISFPLLLSFAGASMMTVVTLEIFEKRHHGEKFSLPGFAIGLTLCAFLDLFL